MPSPCAEHGMYACSQCTPVDDAAKRITAEVMMALTSLDWNVLATHCMAFRLDDGTTDRTLYPDRATALKFQHRPACVFWFRNAMGGVTARDMAIWLAVQRLAYENDRIAWTDPASPDIIISTHGGDVMRRSTLGRVRGRG